MVHAYCFSWQSRPDGNVLSSNLTQFLSDICKNFSEFSTTTSPSKPVITRKLVPLAYTRLISSRTYQRLASMKSKLVREIDNLIMSEWSNWCTLVLLDQFESQESQESQLISLHWPKTLSSKCMNSLLMRPNKLQSSNSCIWGRLPCKARIRKHLALFSSPWVSWERFSSTYDSRCAMNGSAIIIA